MSESINCRIEGHVLIKDDLGAVVLDKTNAIHPQNMARILARALANEPNSSIYRIAFGNGGTDVDAAFNVTYRQPNTGQDNNVAQTFDSRLYRETYSEIVDESLASVGTDPGHADATGTRPGGGAVPSGDPGTPAVSVLSSPLGLTSKVVITAVLNTQEPLGQSGDPNVTDTEDTFVFDEIGLFTSGAPAVASSGIVEVNLGDRVSTDDTGLTRGNTYSFTYTLGTAAPVTVTFQPPAGGTPYTYGELCDQLNTGTGTSGLTGAKVLITDRTGSFTTIPIGTNTNGRLLFITDDTGSTASISLTPVTGATNLFPPLAVSSGTATIGTPVPGKDAGVADDINDPAREQERLVTHLIFAPILKSANRTLTVTYTLTVSVAPTTV